MNSHAKAIMFSQNQFDDLSSERGVDYTRLRNLLKAGKWKEADKETLAVMLNVAQREEEGWLNYESIENFPCTDLHTIDRLWVKYSNGCFGFSVQKRIWESVSKDYEKFGDRVGWRIEKKEVWILRFGTVLVDDLLNFSLSAQEGHLPFIASVRFGESYIIEQGMNLDIWWDVDNSFFSRIQTCKI